MTKLEILTWVLDLAFLARILWQGEILLRNDREKLELERETHKMAKERYEERAKWRDQKRRQQERKTITQDVPASEAAAGPIPLNGIDVAENTRPSSGALRDLPQTAPKSEHRP